MMIVCKTRHLALLAATASTSLMRARQASWLRWLSIVSSLALSRDGRLCADCYKFWLWIWLAIAVAMAGIIHHRGRRHVGRIHSLLQSSSVPRYTTCHRCVGRAAGHSPRTVAHNVHNKQNDISSRTALNSLDSRLGSLLQGFDSFVQL